MGKNALIIGGGFAGCAMSHQFLLHKENWNITIVEKSGDIGAGVKTHWYGSHPYTFGPRHFLTKNESLYEYIQGVIPMRRLDHVFLSYIENDNEFYNFPMHMDDVKKMPDYDKIKNELDGLSDEKFSASNIEEYWLSSVGPTLYEKFAKHYNKKMWFVDPKELDMGVPDWASKGALLHTGKKEAFHDWVTAFPDTPNGYDDYFVKATKGANVLLNTEIEEYDLPKKRVKIGGEWNQYDVVVNTISLDRAFEKCYGELPFIGLDFYPIVLPVKQLLPDNIFFSTIVVKRNTRELLNIKSFLKMRILIH